MSSQEVGTGYVSIVPSFKGGNKAIEAELGNTNVDGISRKVGRKFTGGLKRVVKFGLAGGALFAGLAAKKGLDRLMGIEDARASLAGLGHDAKSIDKIMGNALDAVRGTAFGLADAGKVAASAVAAGIKPGKELRKDLRLIADAATIAKVPLGEMGAIFNKVAASNKIQGDVIAQLNDKGIPIIQLLSKELGTSAAETLKLASKGQVNFKTFSKAMEAGLGGSALKSGNTLRGSIANAMASVGRIGANFLSAIYPKFAKGFQGITTLLGPLETKAGVAGEKLSKIAAITWDKLAVGATAIKDFFVAAGKSEATAAAMDVLSKAGDRLRDGYGAAADALDRIRDSVSGIDLSKIDTKDLGRLIGSAVAEGLNRLVELSGEITQTLGKLFGKVDWAELGLQVGKQVPALLLGLATGIANFDVGPIFSFLGDHWFEVLIGVLTIALAPSKLIGPIAKVLEKIPFAGKLLGWLVRSLNEAGGKLLGYVGDLFKYLWRGFAEIGPVPGEAIAAVGKRVLGIFKSIPSKVREFLDLARTAVGVKGLEIAESLGRGIRKGSGAVFRYVATIPGKILRGVGRLADLLLPGGRTVVEGLARGIRGKLGDVASAVGKIPGKIKRAIPNPKAMLSRIGGFIVEGLLSGIRKAGDRIRGVVDKIVSKIPKFIREKMGIRSPSRVTTKLGRYIGEGLLNGIKSSVLRGVPALDKYLGKITKAIADALSKKKITKAQAKAMNALVAEQAKGLRKLANQIQKHRDKLADLRSQRKDLASSTKDSITGELDLGSLASAATVAAPLTFKAVAGAVSGLATRAKNFARKLGKLLKAGIPAALVQEVAALGTVAGSQVADALLSGSNKDMKKLRADFSTLNTYAGKIGNIVAGGMFNAGIQAQKGILEGLTDDKAITKAAQSLANKLTREVRKALGIKSPSRVMAAQVGRHLPTGVIAGMDQTQALLDARMRDMVTIPPLPAIDPLDSTGSGAGADQRAIYTDTGVLLGWIKTLANGEARLVWADGAASLTQDLEDVR